MRKHRHALEIRGVGKHPNIAAIRVHHGNLRFREVIMALLKECAASVKRRLQRKDHLVALRGVTGLHPLLTFRRLEITERTSLKVIDMDTAAFRVFFRPASIKNY